MFLSDDWKYSLLKQEIYKHDLSKLSQEEFVSYRQNFFPVDEQEKTECTALFVKAWEHNKKENAHHWQNRTFKDYAPFENGNGHFINLIHNVLDWIAMAYHFNEKPLRSYYTKNKHKMQMSERDFKEIEMIFDLFDEEVPY